MSRNFPGKTKRRYYFALFDLLMIYFLSFFFVDHFLHISKYLAEPQDDSDFSLNIL